MCKRKSPTTASPDLLLQMYQMAHSELLVRIQQRDQYYLCIIGSFIAILVGTFSSSFIQVGISFVLFYTITFGLMIFLTCLLWSSCSIYNELIRHIKSIENQISVGNKGKLAGDLQLWQFRIDNKLKNHRYNSFMRAKIIFVILDTVAFIIIVTELHVCGFF